MSPQASGEFNRTHIDNRIIVYAVHNLSEVTILYKYSSTVIVMRDD